VYAEGKEVNLDDNEGEPEQIQWKFGGFKAQCDQPGYEYGEAGFISFDYGGNDIRLQLDEVQEDTPGAIRFSVRVKHVNFRNVSPLRVVAKITWQPTKKLNDEVTAQNEQKIKEFNEKSKFEYEQAFVEAARDRINKMSRVEPRKYEDLREEDNITVVIGFPITEFLELYRGQTNEASALGLLASFLERNKMVVIRIHKIPYITHAAV